MTGALVDLAANNPVTENIAAIGTAAGALISAAAVVAALWIADRNRKHQLLDRKDDLARELQAQADTIIVEFSAYPPQTHMPKGTPHVTIATVSNHSEYPILDAIFQIWTTKLDQDSLRTEYQKIVTAGAKEGFSIKFDPIEGSDWPVSCRMRWRDHYGNQWVLHRGDEYPAPYTGQPPRTTIGS